jgi:hypothetical protein
MAALTRVLQKIFGSTGGTSEFGEFGSDALGSAVTTKDLALIQSLSPYAAGLYAATNSANEPPRIQDINSLYLLFSSQLKYLFQCGIPEWIATEDAYANISFCQVAGTIYQCIVDIAGASGNTSPASDTTHWQSMGFLPGKQLAFNATALGLPFDPTDEYADMKQKIALSHKAGEIVESAVSEAAVAYSAAQSTAHPAYPEYNPIIPLWDSDHDLAVANYPILVPKLRAQASEAYSGSAYVSSFTVTVVGSVATGSGTAWTAMLAALVEDLVVHGGTATNWRTINIAGTDYAIASISTSSLTVTVSGSPTTGSQTAIFYHRRIAGSTTTARVFKDSGRVTMSPDGTLRVAGLRRRFHMQGHKHTSLSQGIASGGNAAPASPAGTSDSGYVGIPITDGTNGTPITGAETEPNSSTVYRAMWAQTLL